MLLQSCELPVFLLCHRSFSYLHLRIQFGQITIRCNLVQMYNAECSVPVIICIFYIWDLKRNNFWRLNILSVKNDFQGLNIRTTVLVCLVFLGSFANSCHHSITLCSWSGTSMSPVLAVLEFFPRPLCQNCSEGQDVLLSLALDSVSCLWLHRTHTGLQGNCLVLNLSSVSSLHCTSNRAKNLSLPSAWAFQLDDPVCWIC